MSYGNNTIYRQTIIDFNDALDKMTKGLYLNGKPQPFLPSSFPWKDVIIYIGEALKAEETGRWGKLSDVVICPWCYIWWEKQCDGCPYGKMHGVCDQDGSLWDRNFGKGVTLCKMVAKQRGKLLTLLRNGLRRGLA